MKTELDKIPSTITISLGLKNKLRTLKGNKTYEEFLLQLIRNRNEFDHKISNKIELTEFDRKSMVFEFLSSKILVDYNEFNNSADHVFDIRIKRIIRGGKEVNLSSLIKDSEDNNISFEAISYKLYFELLTKIIQEETKTNFKHKGRFEDHYLWKKEFENLGLSKKALEYDVLDKLKDYESGVAFK